MKKLSHLQKKSVDANEQRIEACTREVPRLAFVEIDIGNSACDESKLRDLAGEIVSDELFIRRVEPEPRRKVLLH